MNTHREFLSGAIWILSWVAALFFLKFWKKSGDVFFVWFSAAFALLGAERLITLVGAQAEFEGYVIRLCAFVMILIAIVQKNRTK
jgi:hypothetical protein